jgi:peptide/nickel transport system permease protein
LGYLRGRIITYIILWFIALNLDFLIPRLAPGTAAEILANGGRLPQAQVHDLLIRFGLDKPVYVQYILFLKSIFLSFPPNFGFSYQYFPASVSNIFLARLPATALLIACGLTFGIVLSYLAASRSSLRRGGKFEMGSLYTSIALYGTPVYWVAMVLLWIFAVDLPLFPLYGEVGVGVGSGLGYALSFLHHAILPIVTMTLATFGQWYLLLRGSTQQILQSDYILAAKSRGLPDKTIARKYILRNSLLPVVSLVSLYLGNLISIAVVIESVFGYSGIGDLFVDGVVNRDYPVLEGSFFYVTTIVVIAAVIGDIILQRMDPRLQSGVTVQY